LYDGKICYGYIFARGGSKGIPGKNIKLLAGRPLIAYSIDALKGSKHVDRIIVSTDSEEIARVAMSFGAEVTFMRPALLASDDSPEILSWKHALDEAEREGKMPDVMVCASTTSPLRDPEDIDAVIEALISSGADQVTTVTPSSRNPYFNMVTLDDACRLRVFANPPKPIYRRQDAPPVYDETTVAYAARADYVKNCREGDEADIRAVIVPGERAIDIDTQLDFDFAEFVMQRRMNAASRGVA
jgi:N-acylneuraminate cytidylyltransferase